MKNRMVVIVGVLMTFMLISANSLWRITAADEHTDETADEKTLRSSSGDTSAQHLYRQAITAYYRKNHGEAISLFDRFVITYPGHPMADKAKMWIRFIGKTTEQSRESVDPAESLYHQAISAYYRRSHQEAVGMFERFVRQYPRHSMSDKAYKWIAFIRRNTEKKYAKPDGASELYHQALDTYHHRHDISGAISLLNEVIRKYPGHDLAGKARYWIAYMTASAPPEKISPVRQSEQPVRREKPEDSAERLYHQALNAYEQKRLKEASALFGTFSENYPKHPLNDHATYWLGECLYAQNRFYDAIGTFKEVAIRYPKSKKVPDAMLMVANAYLSLDDPANARVYFERVIRDYPSSSSADIARRKLGQMGTKEKKIVPQEDKLQVLQEKKQSIPVIPAKAGIRSW